MLTRRAMIAGALPIAALGGWPARAAPPLSIDVAPLVAQGWGVTAQAIARRLGEALSGRLPPVEGRVVVRVLGISMPAYSGTSAGAGRCGGAPVDQFESEVLVLGQGGAVLRRIPVLSSSPVTSGGPWYAPDAQTRRLDKAIAVNADWIARLL